MLLFVLFTFPMFFLPLRASEVQLSVIWAWSSVIDCCWQFVCCLLVVFCFVFTFMLNNICLLKWLISLCSFWTDRETNDVLLFVVFIVYYLFVSRLRYRPPSEFSSDIQCLRVHQQVQIRWIHGPAARQVVQSGSVWEPRVRRYWGQCDSSTPVWPWPPVPSCCWCRGAQRSNLRCFHEVYFISTFSKPTEQHEEASRHFRYGLDIFSDCAQVGRCCPLLVTLRHSHQTS